MKPIDIRNKFVLVGDIYIPKMHLNFLKVRPNKM